LNSESPKALDTANSPMTLGREEEKKRRGESNEEKERRRKN
jgi:hypothetical protein